MNIVHRDLELLEITS